MNKYEQRLARLEAARRIQPTPSRPAPGMDWLNRPIGSPLTEDKPGSGVDWLGFPIDTKAGA